MHCFYVVSIRLFVAVIGVIIVKKPAGWVSILGAFFFLATPTLRHSSSFASLLDREASDSFSGRMGWRGATGTAALG